MYTYVKYSITQSINSLKTIVTWKRSHGAYCSIFHRSMLCLVYKRSFPIILEVKTMLLFRSLYYTNELAFICTDFNTSSALICIYPELLVNPIGLIYV